MSLKTFRDKITGTKIYKVVKNKYFLATAFFLAWVIFLDSNNIISWVKDLRELSAQEKQKDYYEEAIRRTDEQLKELGSNRDSLEKFAREQYFFHEPDEEVFIIVDENKK